LRTYDHDTNPRQALYEDLFAEAQEWKNAGDHLIIGINANKDVRSIVITTRAHQQLIIITSNISPLMASGSLQDYGLLAPATAPLGKVAPLIIACYG
jgi:hypothetical protein